MSNPSALTTYKKQEGVLGITQDRKSLEWTPSSGGQNGKPALVLTVSTITNLQQTPVNNPKVMLKVFSQAASQAEPIAYVFTFISPSNARGEADTIKAALSAVIQAIKAAENAAENTATGSSAAMAIASALSSSVSGKGKNIWDDDERLKADISLQQSLFKANPSLQKTFMESIRTKPDTITPSQFTSQFWSTRVHLLRAHAIEKSQQRGSYNVLSVLKPPPPGSSTDSVKMNISREQIQLMFNQHPLIKRVYDTEVPKPLDEREFWIRFFQSRLFKKLRGEKIDPSDATDKYLDKYLNEEEFTGRSRAYDAAVPRIIDLEGNEENHSQRKGNAPEFSLRPRSLDKVPIIRTLNSLSEKIMAQVAPSDVDPSQPIGMDEATYSNLLLRDLQGNPEQKRLILKVKDQSHFFSESGKQDGPEDIFAMSKENPQKTIDSITKAFDQHFPKPGVGVLHAAGEDEEPMDVDGGESASTKRTQNATSHIFELLHQHRLQTEPIPGSLGLPTTIYDRVILTHATTTEFLHQFWSAFLSGKSDRATEISSLVESLNRAMDRIEAIAKDAESLREDEVRQRQKLANERAKKTGRKVKIDLSGISGGTEIVRQLLEPTTSAVTIAIGRYQQALREQMADEG
ncbi:putative rna polymerase ii transcription factor related protein [Phaeomoniella chlamydospora]|uniref:Putative rna polymerase ii transcription factor related protein n=1 Tax=Phaeomoniella chlamydospora TaxID=158046 RepID=A0A0G2GXP7_PHACM|nr:putative rna polymerase ii transcription factor related protein [Phaeomoniella chlamydospora]